MSEGGEEKILPPPSVLQPAESSTPPRWRRRLIALVVVVGSTVACVLAARSMRVFSPLFAPCRDALAMAEQSVSAGDFGAAHATIAGFLERVGESVERDQVDAQTGQYFRDRALTCLLRLERDDVDVRFERALEQSTVAEEASDWARARMVLETFSRSLAARAVTTEQTEELVHGYRARVDAKMARVRERAEESVIAQLKERLADYDNDPFPLIVAIDLLLKLDADLGPEARAFLERERDAQQRRIDQWHAERGDGPAVPEDPRAVDAFGAGTPDHRAAPSRATTARRSGWPEIDGLEWCVVPAGRYWVGNPATGRGRGADEPPPTRVEVDRTFLISAVEIPQRVYRRFVTDKRFARFAGDGLPAHSVSFDEAEAFCRRLEREFPDFQFALPSETEWEIAARGAPQSKAGLLAVGVSSRSDVERVIAGGDTLSQVLKGYAVFNRNARGAPREVASKKANPLGLFDVHGNVYEWCVVDPGVFGDPPAARMGQAPVRGGSYLSADDDCRASARGWEPKDSQLCSIGFRLVCRRR